MNELQLYYVGSLKERWAELGALRSKLADQGAGAPADDGAVDTVRKIAHRLKGTGASYGFPAISESAARVEEAAEALQAPDGGEAGDLLETLDAFLVTLEEILESSGAPES